MEVRIRASLIKVPSKKKRAIQLTLHAGFRSRDSITGELKYQTLKIQLPQRILPQFWDTDSGRPTAEFSSRDKFKFHRYVEEHISFLNQAHAQVMDNPLMDVVTPNEVKQCYLQLTGQLRKVRVQSRISSTTMYSSLSPKSQPLRFSSRCSQIGYGHFHNINLMKYSLQEIHGSKVKEELLRTGLLLFFCSILPLLHFQGSDQDVDLIRQGLVSGN